MIAVPPVEVTETVLVSTTAPDEGAWSMATTYSAGATCSRNHIVWTSLQGANLGNTPESSPAWWEDSGPSNQWAMFDSSVTTVTSNGGDGSPLVVVLDPGKRVTSVVMVGLVGARVRLQIENAPGGDVIHDSTINLVSSDGTYWSFCFEPFRQESRAVWTGLESSPLMRLTLTIDPLGNDAKCGLCVFGREFRLGDATFGFATPIKSRGRSYLDKLGNPVRVERGHSINMTGTVQSETATYNRVMDFLSEHIDEPMAWVLAPGLGDYRAATIVGAYQEATPAFAGPTMTTWAMDISGYR